MYLIYPQINLVPYGVIGFNQLLLEDAKSNCCEILIGSHSQFRECGAIRAISISLSHKLRKIKAAKRTAEHKDTMDKETLRKHMQDAQKDIFENLRVELNSWKDVYREKQGWSSFSSIGDKEIELCVYYINRTKQLYRRIKFDRDCTEEIRPIIGEENIIRSFSSIDVKTATGWHSDNSKNHKFWIKFLGEQLDNLSGEQLHKVTKYTIHHG